MGKQYRLISIAAVLFLVLSSSAMAGWGDTLKQAGSAAADTGATAAGLPYTPSEALAGIKDVLSLSTDYATSSLSVPGGFSSNPASAFSLPSSLSGLSDSAGLLSSLNTAAEKSVPGTGNVFLDSISKLSIGDTSTLLNGGEDAITRFLENSARDSIKSLIKPIVSNSVEAAGVGQYLSALSLAQQASGVSGGAFDPVDFVADRTLDGMFSFMAMKERDIRSSGGVGTTDLIQKLF